MFLQLQVEGNERENHSYSCKRKRHKMHDCRMEGRNVTMQVSIGSLSPVLYLVWAMPTWLACDNPKVTSETHQMKLWSTNLTRKCK